MNRLAMTLCLILTSAASASAQSAIEGAFQNASQAMRLYVDGPKPLAPREAARVMIQAVLQRMKARGEVSPGLVRTLSAARASVAVGTGLRQACLLTEQVQAETGRVLPVILCSEAVGQMSRDYASLYIAEQIALLRLQVMPACAEKDYMVVSLMTRSWIEQGGQLMAEPAVAARMSEWERSFGMPDFMARRAAKGQATLESLLRDNLAAQKAPQRTEAELAGLRREEDNLRRAVAASAAFAREESDWQRRWNPLAP